MISGQSSLEHAQGDIITGEIWEIILEPVLVDEYTLASTFVRVQTTKQTCLLLSWKNGKYLSFRDEDLLLYHQCTIFSLFQLSFMRTHCQDITPKNRGQITVYQVKVKWPI